MTPPPPDPGSASAASDDARLLAWLAEHDEACPLCRYNLRGLTVTRCPECRTSLALTVGAPRLRFGAWILGVISCALGLGFDGVMCAVMTITVVRQMVIQGPAFAMPFMFARIYLTLGALAFASLLGLLVMFRIRRRWLGMPIRRQWLIAGVIVIIVGLVHSMAGLLLVP